MNSSETLVLEAVRSGEWTHGKFAERFERAFARYCGARHVALVTNGTAALKIALLAAGIERGDEVIVPGMTWPSVAIAVLEAGGDPVPVDVDAETYAMTAETVRPALTARTRAIVATHLFSSQCDLPPLLELARSRSIIVIEDCAHVPGARRFGKTAGTFGDVAVFSFNQKKLLACGEGGCLMTNRDDLYERAVRLRQVDMDAAAPFVLSGTHLVSDLQAALLLGQLESLDDRLLQMEINGEWLRAAVEAIPHVRPLRRLEGTTRQTFYNFCFRVQHVSDIARFRRELSASLEVPVSGGYRPLSDCAAVDPRADSRFATMGQKLRTVLPRCQTAHYREAVRFPHQALMRDRPALQRIVDAIEQAARR